MKLVSKVMSILCVVSLCIIEVNSVYNNVSAESYESSVGLSFTLNPTISINISGDLSIESLTPGDYKDSNIITVTAESNAVSGYSLSSTVGTSTNTSNELRKDGTDTTNKFSNLSTNQSTLSGFNDNEWGYSYSLDSGSTWISGNVGSTIAGYNGYTYNTTTSTSETITHLDTTTPGSSTIQYKIGAKASTTQLAGEYTNVINFTALAKPNPTPIYIQDLTLSQCQVNVGTNGNSANIGDNITVVDRRDNSIYTVRYINGQCWMTQNLRLTGTISSTYSNFTGNDFNVSEYSLDSNDSSYANYCSIYGYNYACAKDSNNVTTGVWYNYYAATAGTIAGDSNTTDVTEDICPSEWKLPSISEFSNIINYASSLSLVSGGRYWQGLLVSTEYGYWWSTTPLSAVSRYYLIYNQEGNAYSTDYGDVRSNRGSYIRCVRSS